MTFFLAELPLISPDARQSVSDRGHERNNEDSGSANSSPRPGSCR